MIILRSTCIAALLIVGTVSTASAQDGMTDTLKDKAADMAVDKAKTEVKSQMKDAVNNPVADKAMDMGADMATGTSMKDAAQDAMMDGAKSKAKGMATERMPGGGTIKTRASDAPTVIMNDSQGVAYNEGSATETIIMDAPQPLPIPQSTPNTTQSGVPTNCPSGTTGQPNGTCMITGNYSG